MKQFYKYILTVTALLCITSNAWAGKVRLEVYSSPSNGGYVYANTKNENNIGSLAEDYAESGYKVGGSVNMYRFAKAADGYEFKGWADTDGGTPTSSASQISLGASGGADKRTYKYYAIFAPIYTVAFNGNGSTSGTMTNMSMVYNTPRNLSPNAFSRQYTVTYNADGGTCSVSSAVATYTFVGWEDRNSMVYNGKEYTGAEFDAPYYANTYGDLYNAFGYNKYNLLQHYVNNGKGEGRSPIGSVRGVYPNEASVSNLSTTAKATVTLYAQWQSASVILPNATKAGAVIDGWYAGGVKVGEPGDSYTPTANLTLTAKWIEKYTPEITGNNYNLFVDEEQANAFNFKYTNNPTEHIKILSISEVNDGSGMVISYDAANNKIIAHNAGVAEIYFTQAETETIKAGTSATYTITVTKIDNTLAIASNSCTKYVDDVIANVISSVNSDATVTTISSDATIAYYDVTSNTIIIPNSEAKSFSSQAITITIAQAETYKYTATEKTIILTVNKYDISASIVQNSAYLNELIDNAFSLLYGLDGYSVTSLNPDIAKYIDGNKIQTSYKTGTANFRLTRVQDYKYKSLDVTLSLQVNPAGGCVLFETTKNQEYAIGYYDNSDGFLFDLNGVGKTLTMELKRQDTGAGYIYIIGYTNDGTEVSLGSVQGGNLSTSWSGTKYTFEFPEDKDITKIRIKSGNDIWNDALNKYFRNVQVTRKTYLRPTVNSLTLPQATIGKPVSASFDLSWSTCSDEIVLVSTNSNFVLNHYSINTTAGRGTTTITATYDANSGSQSGTIIIYDQSQKIEIPVVCEVKSKLATEIVYTGEAQYNEIAEGIPYPFYVKDENGNTVAGATITLTTTNEDILSFDATKIYPHCGGNVTLTASYAGDATHEPATLAQTITVADCYQYIVWDQNFKTYLATQEGYIDETTLLTAYAVPTETPIQYSLDAAADAIADIQYNGDGTYSLHVHGVGKGHIIARAVACTFEGEQYLAVEAMHELRAYKEGEPCESYALDIQDEQLLRGVAAAAIVLPIADLPESRMEFYAHTDHGSLNDFMYVKFSTDNKSNWSEEQKFGVESSYDWNNPFVATVPEGATHVSFRTTSSLNTYFNCITIRQKMYLRTDMAAITIDDAKVNIPFERSFTVEYSDMHVIQYQVTNSHDLDLMLTPDRPVNNDCGDWGTYTFTLTGESPYPQQAVQETITLFTSSGERIQIPVTITATLSDPFYFNVQNGDWNVSTNWEYQGSTTHGLLPNKAHPVVISKALTINSELVAYSVQMDGGSIEIKENGGLTVHAGGFADIDENNLTIHSNTSGAGFVRVSPFFTTKVPGTMPNAKVLFTTKANMNVGDNRDASWQYIGAPGRGASLQKESSTVLYLRSEQWGWLPYWNESVVALEPFAGYALTQKEQADFTFQSQLINENQTIQLTYTQDGMQGDNLWANSYMAPIDIKKIGKEDFSGAVDQIVYLYNCGSWNEWNKDQSAISSAEALPGRYYAIPVGSARVLDATYDQTVIPPMQGVYMKAGEGGGSLTLNYEKHVWNCTSDKMNQAVRIAGKHSSEDDYLNSILRIRLQVNSQNSGADRMYLIQDATCTADYDNGYDAPKQMTEGLLNLYTNEACGKMEISATDHIDGMYLGFAAGEDDVYTMTFTSLIGDNLYLYDVEQDTLVGMYNGEKYEFAAAANSTNDMRFQILVNPDLTDYLPNGGNGGGVTTDTEDVDAQPLWVHDEKVYIAHASINSTLEIYTISGVAIARYTISYAPCTLDMSALPTGVYMLRLNDQVYKFVCK